MITEHEKGIILQCAKNIMFLIFFIWFINRKDNGANDIDLGVRGIEPNLFFTIYAELVKQFPKPVDLVGFIPKISIQ